MKQLAGRRRGLSVLIERQAMRATQGIRHDRPILAR
jgi:hypothetical protein